VAMLTKLHHSMVDGVSGNEILGVLLDPSPEGKEIPPAPEGEAGERVPGDLEMLGRGLLGVPRQPLRALRSLPTALPNLTDLPGANAFPVVPRLSGALSHVRRLAGGDDDPGILEVTTARAPKTSFNGPVGPHRRFAFGSLSLATVKRLKNELDITVNDVVVALCATAVRDWLLDRDELPKEPLVAMIPVSVRTEEQAGTFGNRISTMIVPIPTNVKDPRKRLLRAHEYLRSAKGRHKALPADQANFPVSVVIDGVGLNMTVMSYRDHVDFGIITDRDQIDDAWALMDGTAAALDELETAICGKRTAAANGRRPKLPA
jgi:diacylglycerol O-acyltransferase